MTGVPRVGQTVQAFPVQQGDGPDVIGQVFADITERTLVILTPAGGFRLVKVKGTRFVVEGQEEIPLGEPPDDDGR